jgi:hypothetical protein
VATEPISFADFRGSWRRFERELLEGPDGIFNELERRVFSELERRRRESPLCAETFARTWATCIQHSLALKFSGAGSPYLQNADVQYWTRKLYKIKMRRSGAWYIAHQLALAVGPSEPRIRLLMIVLVWLGLQKNPTIADEPLLSHLFVEGGQPSAADGHQHHGPSRNRQLAAPW